MENFVITDRTTENTLYFAGLNGWVNLPENAIYYQSKDEAEQQITALNMEGLKAENI